MQNHLILIPLRKIPFASLLRVTSSVAELTVPLVDINSEKKEARFTQVMEKWERNGKTIQHETDEKHSCHNFVRCSEPEHLATPAFSWSPFPHACRIKRTSRFIPWGGKLRPGEKSRRGEERLQYSHICIGQTLEPHLHPLVIRHVAWCLESQMLTTAKMRKRGENKTALVYPINKSGKNACTSYHWMLTKVWGEHIFECVWMVGFTLYNVVHNTKSWTLLLLKDRRAF